MYSTKKKRMLDSCHLRSQKTSFLCFASQTSPRRCTYLSSYVFACPVVFFVFVYCCIFCIWLLLLFLIFLLFCHFWIVNSLVRRNKDALWKNRLGEREAPVLFGRPIFSCNLLLTTIVRIVSSGHWSQLCQSCPSGLIILTLSLI